MSRESDANRRPADHKAFWRQCFSLPYPSTYLHSPVFLPTSGKPFGIKLFDVFHRPDNYIEMRFRQEDLWKIEDISLRKLNWTLWWIYCEYMCDLSGKSTRKPTEYCTNDLLGRCMMQRWFRRKRQEYKMRRQIRDRFWRLIRLEIMNQETISA